MIINYENLLAKAQKKYVSGKMLTLKDKKQFEKLNEWDDVEELEMNNFEVEA